MSYHSFVSAEGDIFGSFEVFYVMNGWYWWERFPGCMPDGDPMGPFNSKGEAITDAREN